MPGSRGRTVGVSFILRTSSPATRGRRNSRDSWSTWSATAPEATVTSCVVIT